MSPRHAWVESPFQSKGRCNWCGVPVPDPRRRWCSEACQDEFWCRASASYARQLVARRDRGVCAKCGVDTQKQRTAFIRLCTWGERGRWFTARQHPRVAKLAQQKYGIPKNRLRGEWWDVDHIVPVVLGGGVHGLENLRTLCIPCHQEATRLLAQRRAADRKQNGPVAIKRRGRQPRDGSTRGHA
jgi:hypothetical protein